MKKLLSVLLIILFYSCTSAPVFKDGNSAPLPLDPAVTHGSLKNGLKYFIRPNGKPENRIVLRLVVNAGSILEDSDQLGLAHLIEHMAFNGTTNFKGHEIVDYLESTGMKFGADINAHTGFDETVYKINLPADDPEMLKTGLTILKEWAFEIAFTNKEIDKERGVIVEEWRSGRGADSRMRDKYFPVLFSGSRYASRLPIGNMEIVKNASYDTIKRFYKDWYQPGLMSVIVVGDVDSLSVKKQIETLFGKYANNSNSRVREEYPVPDNKNRLYSIVTDPEATVTSVQIFYKNNLLSNNSREGYRTYIQKIINNIIFSQRLNELTNKSNPPYIYAFTGNDGLVRTKSAFTMGAVTKDNGILPAFRVLLEENERFMRFGYTKSEFERAKADLLSYMDSVYRERDKTESVFYAEELTDFFLNNTSAPGMEWEWNEVEDILSDLTLDEVIKTGHSFRNNTKPVVIITGPQKDTLIYPDKTTLDNLFATVLTEKLKPYNEGNVGENLLKTIPKAGSIISESHDSNADYNVWKLSNGSKVVFKNTNLKNDEILFSAFSPGGTSLVDDSDYLSATLASNLVQLSGLGDHDVITLGKMLSGKQVSLSPYIGSLYEGFSGSVTPKDSETLFQLLYMYFTSVRRDNTAYESFINRIEGLIANRKSKPEVIFNDALNAALYNNHFRSLPLTKPRLAEVNQKKAYDIFNSSFKNPENFTFIFAGNIPSNFKFLVETYIASIPQQGADTSWVDRKMEIVKGINSIDIHAGIEQKSTVKIIFSGDYDWTLENNTAIYALRELMNIRLREEIREDLSGTYGVGISVSLNKFPKEKYTISIGFNCDPSRVDELSSKVFDVIDELKNSKASNSNMQKIKEGFRRSYEESLKENSYWLGLMDAVYRYKLDSSYLLDKPARNASLTSDILKKAAGQYLDTNNYFKAVLYPEQ